MRKFFLILFSLLFLCTACAEKTPAYSYTETYLRLEAPYGTDWYYDGTLLQTETDGHVYLFSARIPEEKRISCIEAQQILDAMLKKNGIPADGITCTFLESTDNRAVSAEKNAYICTDTVGTWEHILTILQTIYGEYTNYGYLYALSGHTADSLGWAQDPAATTDSADAALFSTNPVLLNLVYPCFTEPYTAPDETAACKALSTEIIVQMPDPFAGEKAFLDLLSAYAQSHGIAFTPTTLAFAYNAPSCPMKIRTRDLEIFLDSTYEDDRGVLENPAQTIPFLETLDSCLDTMHEAFGVEKTEYVPVHLCAYVPNRTTSASTLTGMFRADNGYPEIIAKSPDILRHEYAHYLYYRYTDGSLSESYESWHNEVIAHYFAKEEMFESRLRLIEENRNAAQFETLLGEAYDTVEDEIAFLHLTVGTMTDNPLYDLKTTYKAALSFGAYFADRYSEKSLIACMADPVCTPDLTGFTLDEIVEQWLAWLPQIP